MKNKRRKLAVITGASRGIGLALARTFARAGYDLVITGRDPRALKAAARQIKAATTVTPVVCDVCSEDSVTALLAIVRKANQRIDVLVNNAGVAHALARVEEFSTEVWREVLNTNLTGTFLVTRAALPLMSAGSTIVNNLSVAAVHPFAGMAAYNASKAGALGLTNVLREELRPRGIRVVALMPGATNTDIWEQFWPGAPREKMISADSVAAAVLSAVSLPANAALDEIRIGPAAGTI